MNYHFESVSKRKFYANKLLWIAIFCLIAVLPLLFLFSFNVENCRNFVEAYGVATLDMDWRDSLNLTEDEISQITKIDCNVSASIVEPQDYVSVGNDVYAKVESNTITFYTSQNRIYLPENSSNLFSNLNVSSITTTYFETINTKNMSHMFDGCLNIASLYIRGFIVTNVTDMSYMFANCKSIEELDFRAFETTSLKNMSHMFDGCEKLSLIKYSSNLGIKIDTSGVEDISYVFANCGKLQSIDMRYFDLSSISQVNKIENFVSNCNMSNIILPKKFPQISGKYGELFEDFYYISNSLTKGSYLSDFASFSNVSGGDNTIVTHDALPDCELVVNITKNVTNNVDLKIKIDDTEKLAGNLSSLSFDLKYGDEFSAIANISNLQDREYNLDFESAKLIPNTFEESGELNIFDDMEIELFVTEIFVVSVDFDETRGETSQKSQKVLYGGELSFDINAKNGYSFSNWSFDENVNATTSGSQITITDVVKDEQITANFDEILYSVKVTIDDETKTYNYTISSNPFALEMQKKEGYVFVGWTGSNGDIPQKNVTIQTGSFGDREYVANFEEQKDMTFAILIISVTLTLLSSAVVLTTISLKKRKRKNKHTITLKNLK